MTKDSEEYLKDVSAIREGNGNGLMGGFLRNKSKPPLRLCTIFTGLHHSNPFANKQGKTRLQGGLSERFRKLSRCFFIFWRGFFFRARVGFCVYLGPVIHLVLRCSTLLAFCFFRYGSREGRRITWLFFHESDFFVAYISF